jgi:hypothetical protein
MDLGGGEIEIDSTWATITDVMCSIEFDTVNMKQGEVFILFDFKPTEPDYPKDEKGREF